MDLHNQGGCIIGSNRTIPDSKTINAYRRKIQFLAIDSIVLIGGFEAFRAAEILQQHLPTFIPMFRVVVIPSTISSNVPGTDFTVGTDTALKHWGFKTLSRFNSFEVN